MIKYLNYDIVFKEIPNKVSLALNISNCQNNCIGCHTPILRKNVGYELTNTALIDLINKNVGIDCVIFMGEGNDIDRLIELAKLVKSQNILVALYSGSDIINKKYYKIFDYIKIGRYIKEKGGLNSPTTNQKLYQLKNDDLIDITYLFNKTI